MYGKMRGIMQLTHVISRLGGEAKKWVDYCEPTLSAVFLVKQSQRLHWAGPSFRA